MNLSPKDNARLLDLRRRAEDPKHWNWFPERGIEAIGQERFDQILRDVRSGPDDTKVLSFTLADLARVRKAFRPQEQHLAYDVFVLLEVYVVDGERGDSAKVKRRISLSRGEGRLPEKYVKKVLAKVGFDDGVEPMQNPGSGVWHATDLHRPMAGQVEN